MSIFREYNFEQSFWDIMRVIMDLGWVFDGQDQQINWNKHFLGFNIIILYHLKPLAGKFNNI